MKKIKVLRVIARLNIGGPAVHTVLLAAGLDKSRFDSLLVCGKIDSSEGDMSYYAFERNVKPYFIPELQRELNFFKDIIAFKKIYRLIAKEQPDIIHTHTAKAGAIGRLAGACYNLLHFARGRPIRLIHTFHGHIFEGYFGRLKTGLFISIERLLAIFSSKIITVSESLKKELVSLKIAPGDKIKVIALGFELDRLLSIPFKEEESLNIGIIGRLVPVKNHRLFLEAAAEVIKYNSRVKFKIVGDGELREELEEYSRRLNIGEWVDFLGWQNNLAGVYSGLDIVALTSLNEGTPVSLIEAMAAARPVVATDVGGVRDIMGSEIEVSGKSPAGFRILERGAIVESADALGFAEALIFLLGQGELRRSLGLRGRSFAAERFGKDRLIKDTEGLYKMTLG